MGRAKVLVVDDEEAIRRFLRVALTSQDYAIIEAACGQAALSEVSDNKPDIVMLDLGLPDIDGIEVVRRLREWTRTPIIILSVRGSESDKITALDAGPCLQEQHYGKPNQASRLHHNGRYAIALKA